MSRSPDGAARPARRGFTLVELLVSITVAALLLALILPAVQYSRESARRAACASNLRQVGVAFASYTAAKGHFPDGATVSPQGRLLEYLEQPGLARELRAAENAGVFRDFGNPARFEEIAVPSPSLRCPSDGSVGIGATNYSGNFGTGVREHGFDGLFWFLDPQSWGAPVHIGPRHVHDGLSNTAAFAEIVRGVEGASDPRRGIRRIPAGLSGTRLAEHCLAVDSPHSPFDSPVLMFPGRRWYRGGVETLYNHVLPPDAPNCLSGGASSESAISAASEHRGGVQVLVADGAVRFVADEVDPALWRALGSRAGGEAF